MCEIPILALVGAARPLGTLEVLFLSQTLASVALLGRGEGRNGAPSVAVGIVSFIPV